MSIYPAPTQTTIFNPVDYENTGNDNTDCCDDDSNPSDTPVEDSEQVHTNTENIEINKNNISVNAVSIASNGTNILSNTHDISLLFSSVDTLAIDTSNNKNDIDVLESKTEHITSDTTHTILNKDVKVNNDMMFIDENDISYGRLGRTNIAQNSFIIENNSSLNNPILINTHSSYLRLWGSTLWIGGNTNGKIYMNGEYQNHAYTDDDRNQIAENKTNIELNIQEILHNTNDIDVLQLKTEHITSSTTHTILNKDVIVNNDLTFEDDGISYGRIGRTDDGSNAFVIETSTSLNNSIFVNTKGGYFRIWGDLLWLGGSTAAQIYMNGKYQNHAYTDEDRNQLAVNTVDVVNLKDDVQHIKTVDTNTVIESDVEMQSCKISGSLTFDDNTEQTTAFSSDYVDKITKNTDDITSLQIAVVPVGTILTTARPPTVAPPDGFKYCDGELVSKTKYSELWNIIGNTYAYNKPLYSSHFYLPDLRQLFIRGGQMNMTYPVDAIPVAMGTYQKQNVMKHSHDYERPANSHTVGHNNVSHRTVWDDVRSTAKTTTMYDKDDTEILNNQAETRPECITMNYMIKT